MVGSGVPGTGPGNGARSREARSTWDTPATTRSTNSTTSVISVNRRTAGG